MPRSIEQYREAGGNTVSKKTIQQQSALIKNWPKIEEALLESYHYEGDLEKRDPFLEQMLKKIKAGGGDYLETVRNLGQTDRAGGSAWLQSIVDRILNAAFKTVFSLNPDD